MITKYYRANKNITVSVSVCGVPRMIQFFPHFKGSLYVTSNPAEQNALEENPWFNKKYTLMKTDVIEPKEETKTEKKEPNLKQINVSGLADAQEYLIKEFNANEKQLSSKVKIKNFAFKHGVEFIGL